MDDVASAVAARLDAEAVDASPLQGGMIGEVHRVDLADGRRVVAKRGETPLTVEASMLRYLGEHGLPVPDVLAVDDDLLVLSFVEGSTTTTPASQRAVADALADLHDHTADAFGFETDTLLGPLELPNPWTDSWVEFFAAQRLGHFADVALERGAVAAATAERVRSLADDLETLLIEPDAPALLHGDVWRENVLTREADVAAFLDPACYYGHPEEELAYVAWSDAYGDAFFERYRERRGIDGGFDRRRRVYAIPRVLVHAICFGGGYPRRLRDALDDLGY